jgi:hypothetical protein
MAPSLAPSTSAPCACRAPAARAAPLRRRVAARSLAADAGPLLSTLVAAGAAYVAARMSAGVDEVRREEGSGRWRRARALWWGARARRPRRTHLPPAARIGDGGTLSPSSGGTRGPGAEAWRPRRARADESRPPPASLTLTPPLPPLPRTRRRALAARRAKERASSPARASGGLTTTPPAAPRATAQRAARAGRAGAAGGRCRSPGASTSSGRNPPTTAAPSFRRAEPLAAVPVPLPCFPHCARTPPTRHHHPVIDAVQFIFFPLPPPPAESVARARCAGPCEHMRRPAAHLQCEEASHSRMRERTATPPPPSPKTGAPASPSPCSLPRTP